MAVTSSPPLRIFFRLKLRLLRNSFRGAGWRIALAVIGLLGGVWFSFVGFFGLALTATFAERDAYTLAVLAGTGLVLGWITLPVLVFGVDETLDPTRFALLPVGAAALRRGLLAAALIGIPPVMTLLATQGLVLGAGVQGGVGAAVTAFLGTVAGLLLCVVLSRAVTTALANALRSRRAREAAVLVIALLAGGLGPLQLAGLSIAQTAGAERLAAAARVLAWTPLGAPYAVGFDVAFGRWPQALARLAIVVVTLLLLMRWWAATLPVAMVGLAGPAAGRRKRSASPDGSSLVPVALRRLPSARLSGLLARECRYWWREPRRRSTLTSVVMAVLVLPVLLLVTGAGAGLPWLMVFGGSLAGGLLANQFGLDGSAYAANLLAGVPGRVEIGARVLAVSGLIVPLLVLIAVGLGTVGAEGSVAAAVGVAVAAYGGSAALATVMSVLVPYALPESTNPFALSTGTGGIRGFVSFAPVIVGGMLGAPLALAPAPVALLAGLAMGAVLPVAGVLIAGNILDQRGWQVLQEVTPRR